MVTSQAPTTRRGVARSVVAALCLLQAVVLAGFAVFYVVELLGGGGSDQARVVTSAALILLFALGLGALGHLWWHGSGRVTTPTVVWNVLLVPVAIGLAQSGQALLCVLLVVVLVAAIGAAVLAARDRD